MASTSLAYQLKKLQTPQTQLLVHKKKKASFIFSFEEAAKFDRDAFYELGLNGLKELEELNPYFAEFENTLFDLASKNFERAVESVKANKKLNHYLRVFLIRLCPYFVLKSSHKALEWLIQRYHIHEFNIDDIMFLILPYYETVHFAKMLSLMPIKKEEGRWHWLYNAKKSGAPLSNSAIFNRAAGDFAFLKFVCNMPTEAIRYIGCRSSDLHVVFNFYGLTVVGGLHTARQITDHHLTAILPSLVGALSSSSVDLTAAGFYIIFRLITKVCLSDQLLNSLTRKLTKVAHLYKEAVVALVMLAGIHEESFDFPDKALQNLVQTEWFLPCFLLVTEQAFPVRPFAVALLRTSLRNIQTEDTLRQFVQDLLEIHYQPEDVKSIFQVVLEEFSEDSSSPIQEETLRWYNERLRTLEYSYPRIFDEVVSEALSKPDSRTATSVSRILGGINMSRNDLFLQLVHPNSDMRVQAIKHIHQHFQPQQVSWLSSTLLERLKEDYAEVVMEVLLLPAPLLASLSQEVLASNLIAVVATFTPSAPPSPPVLLKALHTLLTLPTTSSDQEPLILIALLPHLHALFQRSTIPEEAFEKFKFLESLRKNIETAPDLKTAIWNTLNSREELPHIEVIIKTLEDSAPLRSHSPYWFSATLLIAAKITEHPSQTTGDLIMNFLMDYLKFPKLEAVGSLEPVTVDNLHSLMEGSLTGPLPVQGALHCLNRFSAHIQHTTPAAPKIIDFRLKQHSFMLSIYRLLQEGCKVRNRGVRKAFKAAFSNFLQENFPSAVSQINFLVNGLVFDASFGQDSLDHVLQLLSADTSLLSSLLKDHSHIVPCLFLLLASSSELTRSRCLAIFSAIGGSLATGFYRPLVDDIISEQSELLLDPEQIKIFSYKYLSPEKDVQMLLNEPKAKLMQNILRLLVTIINAAGTPIYFKAKLLQVLQYVRSKELLLDLIPSASVLIGRSASLDKDQSIVLFCILERFNDEVVDCLDVEKTWDFLRNVLSDHTTLVLSPDEEKGTSPSAIIMKQITRKFFDKIPPCEAEKQQRLLTLILDRVADAVSAQVVKASTRVFKEIVIRGETLVSMLASMVNIVVPLSPSATLRARNRKSSGPLSLQTLETPEWKRGVCLLELIQNKKKLTQVHLLLPTLFSLLKKCLQFEEQIPVEYPKQLLLSSILHCCEKLSQKDGRFGAPPETLQADVIVECVRASQNPQTHHHALLALTYIAHLLPEQVLHNIMAIFTFIGSSVLRQDDSYSFQIISKIIETVIPILIKCQKEDELEGAVIGVLRVFVAAILDVPQHRRIPLFKKLLYTLNNGQFLWIFLCLIFEKHVNKYNSSADRTADNLEGVGMVKERRHESGGMPKLLDTGLQICSEFPPSVVLNTSFRLLQYISKLPHDNDPKLLADLKDKNISAIFDLQSNSKKTFRHYKYTLLMFLSWLLSSNNFVQEITTLSDDDHKELECAYCGVVEQCLVYIRAVSVQVEESGGQPTAKYWRAVLSLTYDILDKTNALLPTDVFLNMSEMLLTHRLETVRKKAMELLGWRLQQPLTIPHKRLHRLLEPLLATLGHQGLATQQVALFTIKLMARHMATTYPKDFEKILDTVTVLVTERAAEGGCSAPTYTGSLVLCLAELVSILRTRAIPLLPSYLPPLIALLHRHRTQPDHSAADVLLLSIVTGVQKILETLSPFLNPYLPKLLYEISLLSAKCDADPNDQKTQPLAQKLKTIRQRMAGEMEVRLLVPATTRAYRRLMKHGQYEGVAPLMALLAESFTSAGDLTPETTALFLDCLQLRSTHPEPSLQVAQSVEDAVMGAITRLVLKLSEASFRPFFSRIYHWALQPPKERAITFYGMAHGMALSLKGLFSLFAGIFVQNAAELLDKNNSAKQTEDWFLGETATQKSLLLLNNILNTFLIVFTYDSQKFLTNEYFNILMEPLVDQLENSVGGEDGMRERWSLLTPCISGMATSTGDDSLWKRLNHQVLLKTRHTSPQVRLAGLRTTCALAAKLGEDFMPLLPETVPFLAELLEDDVEEVEKECQRVVNEMEEILGEPIQKYF